jgi:hypothetical protein
MEDESRAQFHHRENAEPSDSRKCLSHRSTLILSSTSPVTRSRLDRLTYSPCLFRVPHREGWTGGHIMQTKKTLPKVCSFCSAHVEAQCSMLRRHGTRHLGSRSAQVTVSQRYHEQGTGCSASRTSGSFLLTPSGPRYNGALVPASLEGIVRPRYLWYIIPTPRGQEYMNNIRVVDDIVRQTEQLMSEFYGDQETSYVFTADHGMSKIGNHGDGGMVLPLL